VAQKRKRILTHFLSVLILSISLFVSPFASQATSFIEASTQELSRESQIIVRGSVLARSSVVINGMSWTAIDVSVLETFKGAHRISEGSIRVVVPGGTNSQGQAVKVAGTPEFQESKEYVFFLSRANDGSLLVESWREFLVAVDKDSGNRYVISRSKATEYRSSRQDAHTALRHAEPLDVADYDSFIDTVLENSF